LKAQHIVTELKKSHSGDAPAPVIDAAAAVKIQKMFRRSNTQKQVRFQTNWKVRCH
jgi:hypothetical protein